MGDGKRVAWKTKEPAKCGTTAAPRLIMVRDGIPARNPLAK